MKRVISKLIVPLSLSMRLIQGLNRLTHITICHCWYESLFSLRNMLLLSCNVSASVSGVNFRFIAPIAALIDFCPFDELYEVAVDFGLVFSPLDLVFGLVKGAETRSADEILLSIIHIDRHIFLLITSL